MHSSSPNFNCETTYSSYPLNIVIGVRAEEVDIVVDITIVLGCTHRSSQLTNFSNRQNNES